MSGAALRKAKNYRWGRSTTGSTAVPDDEYRSRYPYRIGWYLQRLVGSEWRDLYFFKEDEYYDTDWEHLNFATSHQPGGFFTTNLMMSIQTEGGKVTLDGYKLRIKQGETSTLTHLQNDEERDRAITKGMPPTDTLASRSHDKWNHLHNDEERDRAITKYFGIQIP